MRQAAAAVPQVQQRLVLQRRAGCALPTLADARLAPRPPPPSLPPSDAQAWQAAGASIDWCRDLGVDGRSMRFARDIRQQLERIIGPDGSGFDGGSARRRAERQRGSEGGEAGGSGEAARRDEQPAADGRQREDDRERGGEAERDGGGKREREWQSDGRGGKRPRRSGGFSDAATVAALRMALTIGALWSVCRKHCGAAALRCLMAAAARSAPPPALPHLPAVRAAALAAAGFANRLARRMPMHNGYRTLGESSTLAQACLGGSVGWQAAGPRSAGWAGVLPGCQRAALEPHGVWCALPNPGFATVPAPAPRPAAAPQLRARGGG